MKKNLLVQFLLAILLFPSVIMAQNTDATINSTLSGQVLDEKTNEPLIGASVQIKGTTHGVITDAEGKFYFKTGQKLPYTLIVNYIGYELKEVQATTGTITVSLQTNAKQLSEIVVVGYGTQERKNLIGSITKVDPSEVNAIPVGSIDAQLQGKVSGVQI